MNDLMNQDDNNKEGFFGRIKASFTGRKFRSGVYVSFISAIVIAMVLVVNLIVSRLDLKVDLSSQKLYTLSTQTKQVVSDIKDDVTIYYLVESGQEMLLFKQVAEKYDSLSDHISFVEKDPVLYPQFAKQYVDASVTVNPGSFLVVNNKTNRAKYVDISELTTSKIDPNTYQETTTGIDIEGKLTSAIQYVTTTNLPVLYETTGHMEATAGDVFKSTLDKQNVTVKSLSTLTQQNIPDDCKTLLINTPQSDFTTDEITTIKNYMAKGGNVMVVADYRAAGLPNFNSLLQYYGVQLKEGVVVEGDANMHVPQYPHYLVPNVLSNDITSEAIKSKRYVIMPVSSGLVIMDNLRSSLKVNPLLTTSDKAYSKVNTSSQTFDKEIGDIDGPFNLGVVAVDTYNDVTAKMVVYSSSGVFDDQFLQTYGNADILTGTVSSLSGTVSAVSVPTKSAIQNMLYIKAENTSFWGIAVIGVLPALILAFGGFVAYRRRKR